MTVWEWIKVGELGKRAYDVWVSRGAPFHTDGFMQKHSQVLRESIDLVRDIDRLNPEQVDKGIGSLLGHLASVVKAINKSEKVSINANYMIPRVPSVALRDQAIFTRKDRDPASFRCFLTLERWATRDNAYPHITLPVEKEGSTDALLFGAPKCFVYQRVEKVPDTLDQDLEIYEHETLKIRQQMSEFFRDQKNRLRSFASFPVVAPESIHHNCPYPTVAVVNIDSSGRRLLGFHWSNQHKIELALEPVIHVLSYFLIRKHFSVQETEAPANPS